MKKSGKYQIDMCHGPLLKKIIIFAVPLMLANISSLMFTAADLVVLGQFSSGTGIYNAYDESFLGDKCRGECACCPLYRGEGQI